MPTVEEQEVFIKIIKEFYRLRQQFYKSTGDGRKDAALKLALQIKLLIKACSTPTEFPDYKGDKFFSKARVICQEIEEIKGKVAVGCTSIKAVKAYKNFFKQQFPHRKLFVIMGEIDFDRRLSIIKRFEETENGILLCTQQSLKSSANIPSCDEVFLEALQWNMPRMEQFFFRFIRFDSEGFTRVRMVTYANSIEQNLLAMIMDKQRSNDFMGSGIVTEEQEIFEEYGIDTNILDTLFYREKDDEGDFQITWGNQQIYA